jgi:hypothetical protein
LRRGSQTSAQPVERETFLGLQSLRVEDKGNAAARAAAGPASVAAADDVDMQDVDDGKQA